MEDKCRSTWVSEVFERQRCHYVHFLAHSSGSALPEETAGSDREEDVADSILDNLSPLAGDVSPMGSQEYDKWCVEMDAAVAADAQEMLTEAIDFGDEANSAPPKEVMATVAKLDQGASISGATPPDAGIPAPTEPPAIPRMIRPVE